MCQLVKVLFLISLVFLLNRPLTAQDDVSDLRKTMEELLHNQKEMNRELSAIKTLLSKLPAMPSNNQPPSINVKDVEFEIGDNPVLGNGKFILVEFTDYECPFCSRYVKETFPQILKEYVDTGILGYTVIDQPLPIHPRAEKAAQAAHCASDQGKYWEIHKLMMTQQDSLNDLSSYARTLDLNISEFEECLAADKYKERIQANMALARSMGITGVPGFVIGFVDAQNPGSVKGISSVRGAMPFTSFQKEIEAAIAANN